MSFIVSRCPKKNPCIAPCRNKHFECTRLHQAKLANNELLFLGNLGTVSLSQRRHAGVSVPYLWRTSETVLLGKANTSLDCLMQQPHHCLSKENETSMLKICTFCMSINSIHCGKLRCLSRDKLKNEWCVWTPRKCYSAVKWMKSCHLRQHGWTWRKLC